MKVRYAHDFKLLQIEAEENQNQELKLLRPETDDFTHHQRDTDPQQFESFIELDVAVKNGGVFETYQISLKI